jgi:hypothetical protein
MKRIFLFVMTLATLLALAACSRTTEEERRALQTIRELENALMEEFENALREEYLTIPIATEPPVERQQGTGRGTGHHPAPTSTPEPESEPAAVVARIDLPVVIRNTVFIGSGNVLATRITSDGILQSGRLGGRPQAWEWETIETGVRSFALNTGSSAGLFYIKDDNTLWGFGSNSNGLLGDGTGVNRDEPVLIMENVAWLYVIRSEIAYALQLDGTLWTWGRGNFAPVHVADDVVNYLPNENRHENRFVYQTRTGGIYSCSLDGTITRALSNPVVEIKILSNPNFFYNFGDFADFINAEQELIRQTVDLSLDFDRVIKYEVIATGVESMFPATGNNLFWITFDGTLWGMGDNTNGELGNSTKVPQREPVQIAENVVYARAYAFLKNDGTFWTWNQDNPTPQQVLTNVAMEVDGVIFLHDGRVIRNFGTNQQSEIPNVRIPFTSTYMDGVISASGPEPLSDAESRELRTIYFYDTYNQLGDNPFIMWLDLNGEGGHDVRKPLEKEADGWYSFEIPTMSIADSYVGITFYNGLPSNDPNAVWWNWFDFNDVDFNGRFFIADNSNPADPTDDSFMAASRRATSFATREQANAALGIQ